MQNENNNFEQPLEDVPNELVLANAVHEIRTPVQTIIGTLDLLSDTQLTNEQIEYLHQIRFGADVLLTLVNDILDFSKIKSQKLKIEQIPFNVKELTDSIVNLISIEAFKKNLEVVTDIDYTLPDLILGDPNRIQQILLNILKNAVKFTERGYIHIEVKPEDEKTIRFSVTDSGIGISEIQRKKLFNNYYQGDPSISRKYGGTGLGLSICKALIQKMNGYIGVTPNPYGGSSFWFTLPLITVTRASDKPYELPIPAQSKILIVDDSSLATNSLKTKLNIIGLRNIQTTANANDALLTMQYATQLGDPFEYVFIDMKLPVYDGWHLASEIKNSQALSSSKLFLMIPEGQLGQKAKMKVLNWFTGYLYKPITLDKLDQLLLDSKKPETANSLLKKIQNEEKVEPTKLIAKNTKILLAEDHPVNRTILSDFLKKFGAQVIEAENGEIAIKKILENPEIKIIFMDIQMPVLSGIDATIILRRKNYDGIILACTANNDPEEFAEYQRIGMNDILVKPFKRETIGKMLEKWISVMKIPETQDIPLVQSTIQVNDELWDSKDFEDTVGNNKEFGIKVLNDYIEQTKNLIEDAKRAIFSEDMELLHRTAHTIKGSSATISANKLYKIGDEISTASKTNSPETAVIQINVFEERFNQFILAVENWKNC